MSRCQFEFLHASDFLKQQDSDGPPTKRCKCDLTAVERTVNKEGPNKGRTFWTCPNSEHARCQFFEWGDETEKSTPVHSQERQRSNDECFKVLFTVIGLLYTKSKNEHLVWTNWPLE